jgi:hypothetical protein
VPISLKGEILSALPPECLVVSQVMHVNPVKRETIDFSNGPPKEILEQPVPPRPGERAPMQNARIPGAENARVVGIFDDENAGYQS